MFRERVRLEKGRKHRKGHDRPSGQGAGIPHGFHGRHDGGRVPGRPSSPERGGVRRGAANMLCRHDKGSGKALPDLFPISEPEQIASQPPIAVFEGDGRGLEKCWPGLFAKLGG